MGHLNLKAPRSLKPVLIRHETVSVEIPGVTEQNFEDHKIKLSDREQLSLQHFNLHQCQSGHQADLKASTCSLLWVVSGLCSAQHLQTLILCITESTQGLQQSAALHTRPQTQSATTMAFLLLHVRRLWTQKPSCSQQLFPSHIFALPRSWKEGTPFLPPSASDPEHLV